MRLIAYEVKDVSYDPATGKFTLDIDPNSVIQIVAAKKAWRLVLNDGLPSMKLIPPSERPA